MSKNSQKQQEILDFINKAINENGYPPTVREICAAVGLNSPSTVHGYLRRMEESGLLEKSPNKKRSLRLSREIREENNDEELMHVPVLGMVTAGSPILAVENIERTFPLPMDFARNRDVFMLRVRGESMINKGILDGDYVIVSKQPTAHNGEMVVALIDDEATVKTFYRENNHIRLQPENDFMEPIIVESAVILGKVIGVYRII